jgi:transcriptional regulator GlxA family with amidase domain
MKIVFALYEGMTALDLVGPFQVFAVASGGDSRLEITLAASTAGPKRTDSAGMMIHADKALSDVTHADVIVVPGTGQPQSPLRDKALLAWLAEMGPKARLTTSVCTGSLVLGAAGLLRGKRATTHWAALDMLREFGAEPVRERVVVDGSTVTGAGVSAGIDMALSVLAQLVDEPTARKTQLIIEYDPQPPFDSGSPASAGPEIVKLAMELMASAAPEIHLAGSRPKG